MYEEYFGLDRPPFKITPDTSLFYDGGKRGDILGALVYAVHRGEGIVKVVGEVGSGKTMLCRMLQLKLPKSVEIIYIANPSVPAEDILFVIAHELSLSVNRGSSKHEVMHLLQDYLLQRHMEDKQVVLFIEEAQGMPLDTLEEIRLLSNLETDQNKLLQIILFGQPELDDNLAQQSIRQLRERITHSFNLSPLTCEEIYTYLNFRMREVGYTGPELVEIGLARKIEQFSGGLLRRINIIADKILLSAFAEGTHNLTSKHVLAAVNDSGFASEVPGKTGSFLWFTLFAVLTLGVLLLFTQSLWMSEFIDVSGVSLRQTDSQTISKNEGDITENNRQSVEPEIDKAVPEIESEKQVPQAVSSSAHIAEKEVQTSSETPLKPSVEKDITEKTGNIVMQPAQSASIKTKVVENKQEIAPIKLNPNLTADNNRWLNGKLVQSRDWLRQANGNNISIQVMVSRKSAAKNLVNYLRNDWPLDLTRTYVYEVKTKTQVIYRVFYSEFDSFAKGQHELKSLPESVKVNQPYLQSVRRIRKALL